MIGRVSIIIPEKRIGKTLKEYISFFKEKKSIKELKDFEILVVLNACKDKTIEIVKEEQKKSKELIYLNLVPGGKGFAITEGFKDSLKRNNDLIGFVDADMATSPKAFYDLVKNINKADGLIASRYIHGAEVRPKQSFQRIIASRTFNFLIRCLFMFKYRDTQCGAKVFKRRVIEKITPELKITQWAFDVNLIYLCKRKGFKIEEFPTKWQDKEYSKINLMNAGPQMASAVVRLRLFYSPFRFMIKAYDLLPERIKLHSLRK
jgi:glycosyltransferase involved in cell wall biosynthesis